MEETAIPTSAADARKLAEQAYKSQEFERLRALIDLYPECIEVYEDYTNVVAFYRIQLTQQLRLLDSDQATAAVSRIRYLGEKLESYFLNYKPV